MAGEGIFIEMDHDSSSPRQMLLPLRPGTRRAATRDTPSIIERVSAEPAKS